MPGGDSMWYCHACNAEMRQMYCSDVPNDDDPRAFNAMGRLFEQTMGRDRERGGVDRNIGLAIDPIGQLLGAVLGMRNLGPETPPRGSPRSTSPEPIPGSGRPTISIRRESGNSEGGRSRSGMHFSFRSGSGSSTGGIFGGFGRREERQEPPGLMSKHKLKSDGRGPGGHGVNRGEGGRPPPMLQHMLMGLLGAGVAQPGVGVGGAGNGDGIITQLMDANHSAPVPVPEDMISAWPRTILTPDNPLENQDCAVCKESFKYEPPEPNPSQPQSSHNPEPQEALTLPCKHSFHVECIEPWVKVKGTCPVCRFELVSQGQRGQDNNVPGGSGNNGNSGSGSGNSGPHRSNSNSGSNNSSGEAPLMPGAYYDLD
ncbi:RING-H2 zinc finger domain [Rhizoctonia solani]|uniref:RING-H2 zinc finger domain n=1 Tax=Rhizoctonia solani TaxID=456999 RepID=A0A8H7IAX7_9AGAM|nr:RING-H2 zinc finger domain [Rhizoctonia solani]